MKLIIVIEGESAKELFAVGPKDMKEWFLLNECLHVKPEDVKSIIFQEVVERDGIGFPTKIITNKENF